MFGLFLRRLTTSGLRKGVSGSTPWLLIGIVASGIRLLRHLARTDDEILYRTVVKAGDVFEVITRPKR